MNQLTKSMTESLKNSPHLTSVLIPRWGVGCRRLTPGIGYLESLGEKNVDVVTQDITKITPNGIIAADGVERIVDTIICATVSEVNIISIHAANFWSCCRVSTLVSLHGSSLQVLTATIVTSLLELVRLCRVSHSWSIC